MPQIRVKNGQNKGQVVQIQGTATITIGRDPSNKLQIFDKGASREHSEIFRVGEMVFIRDLNSRNGTFVNDEQIEEELLREGDVIRIGNTNLLFESTENAKQRDLKYDDNELFKTSLDMKVDDILKLEGGMGERESEFFSALDRIVKIVHSGDDEKRILEGVLDVVLESVPADHLYLFLRDDEGTVVPKAMRQKGTSKGSVPVSRTILRRVISESRAILTADAMQDERFKAGDSIVMGQIRSVLCTPIQSDPSPSGSMGAIYAVNVHMAESFEQADLQFLTTLGKQLAYALENNEKDQQLQGLMTGLVARLVSLQEKENRYRSERIATIAVAVAEEMKLATNEIISVRLASLLHALGDVDPFDPEGKNSTDEEESRTGDLPADLKRLRNLFFDLPGIQDILTILMSFRERFDGNGAPAGIKGKDIPRGARILSVAKGFVDLLSEKLEGPVTSEEPDVAAIRFAFTELGNQAGETFDMEIVRSLIVAYRHGALWPTQKTPKTEPAGSEEDTTGMKNTAAGAASDETDRTKAPVTGHSTTVPKAKAEDAAEE